MEQGLLYCFMVLGVYITFRVLDFPDLTVDGSLPLGAAVTAAMATGGHSVYLATAAGMGAGLVAGLFTGLLHLLLKMGQADATNYGPKLLSGILMMTALHGELARYGAQQYSPPQHRHYVRQDGPSHLRNDDGLEAGRRSTCLHADHQVHS